MYPYSVISEKSLLTCRYLAIIAAIAAPASTAVTGVACIAMLITWLVSGQAWQSLKISASQPAGKVLLLFFAWLIIGCFYADTAWADKLITLSSWKKLLYTFILFGIFYQIEWKTRFVYGYLIAMSVAVIVSTCLWLLHIDLKHAGAGIFMSNYSSQSLAFVAAIVCCVFLLKESFGGRKKYLLIGLIIVFLFNIFFISASRSGYLALPVAAVFAFINLYGYKKIPHILGAMLVALVLIISMSGTLQQRIKFGLHEKANYQTSKELTSVGVRVIFAQNTWELIQEKPIFGYGTSSFKSVYAPHVAKKYSDWRNGSTTDPHVKVAIAASSLFNSNFKTFPEGHLLAFFVGCLLAKSPFKKEENHGISKI